MRVLQPPSRSRAARVEELFGLIGVIFLRKGNLRGDLTMDSTTLLIILIVLVVLGGGGFYGRGRWY